MEDNTTLEISDLLRQFIEALVEEMVLERKPIDEQKKQYLQQYCQKEGVNYTALETNLMKLVENIKALTTSYSKSGKQLAKLIARDCYLDGNVVDRFVPSKYECVNLGLPSGTLWATCNIGANAPEESGDYFAWGETRPKREYSSNNYKFSNGIYPQFQKTLQPGDDASTVNCGMGWRTPTEKEWKELIEKTTRVWTIQKDVEGCLFTASNGNRLFLPAAGYRDRNYLQKKGSECYYWSNSLERFKQEQAGCLYISSNHCNMSYTWLCQGLSVRPVRSSR